MCNITFIIAFKRKLLGNLNFIETKTEKTHTFVPDKLHK